MIIIDIPEWMIYTTWFIGANIFTVVAIMMWMWVFNKIEQRKHKNGRTLAR